MKSRFSPLAVLAAVLPAMLATLFLRDAQRPAVFLLCAVLVILGLGSVPARIKIRLCVGLLLIVAVMTGLLRLSVDATRLAAGQTPAAYAYATSLRVAAVAALAVLTGVSAQIDRLGRALVQQARVPARIGYLFRLSARMVPRIRREIAAVALTHRARGQVGGPVRRTAALVVPVVAGHVRYAERVALAMDARGFADAQARTERVQERWRLTDSLLVGATWASTAAVIICLPIQ